MSEPIRNNRNQMPTAPYARVLRLRPILEHITDNMANSTPQNTPANNAPISSHATAPGMSSINEGKLKHETSKEELESGIRTRRLIAGL
jgi:nucleosome assembly protein 1-like 1